MASISRIAINAEYSKAAVATPPQHTQYRAAAAAALREASTMIAGGLRE